MDLDDALNSIANYITIGSFVPLLVFIILYATRSPWRGQRNRNGVWEHNELGVALMAQKISFLAVFVVVGASPFLNDYPSRGWVRILVFSAVLFFLCIDVVNLLRYQHRAHTKKPPRR